MSSTALVWAVRCLGCSPNYTSKLGALPAAKSLVLCLPTAPELGGLNQHHKKPGPSPSIALPPQIKWGLEARDTNWASSLLASLSTQGPDRCCSSLGWSIILINRCFAQLRSVSSGRKPGGS